MTSKKFNLFFAIILFTQLLVVAASVVVAWKSVEFAGTEHKGDRIIGYLENQSVDASLRIENAIKYIKNSLYIENKLDQSFRYFGNIMYIIAYITLIGVFLNLYILWLFNARKADASKNLP